MAYLQRKNIRWANYDYTLPGYYFITIVTYKRKTILSKVKDGEIYLSVIGREINRCLREIHKKFITVRVDDFVIMPNHIHFIIENNGKESIAKVVRTIKALTSCQYTKQIKDNDVKLWQRMGHRTKRIKRTGDKNGRTFYVSTSYTDYRIMRP